MRELLERIRKFNNERDWDQFHTPKNLAMAMSVEVAEIVEHFQWMTEQQSQTLNADKIEELKDEIGDVMIYLVNLSDKLGIDPIKAAKEKIEKNRKNYPAKLAKGKTNKYNDL